ncbi:MAG: type II toxin-antitoxin system VapC family toxin [Holophagaceae bacterium]|nr:type II toxin-antitoxin system VapC family toxin [Holophagaceae bacterium]
MSGRYLFDTNAIVYYLQGHSGWVSWIDNTKMTERFASVITRMELLSFHGISKDEEDRINRFLDDVIVVAFDENIENTAIAMRRAARLKLPDAIVAATSVTLEATLITGDQHLKDLDWPGFHVLMAE